MIPNKKDMFSLDIFSTLVNLSKTANISIQERNTSEKLVTLSFIHVGNVYSCFLGCLDEVLEN